MVKDRQEQIATWSCSREDDLTALTGGASDVRRPMLVRTREKYRGG